ncbi:alpha/beta-type small acid-soluble spore protein [uncultured Clostridium sp.]|uniref:alpha/beta-type small acid-soluble spore protein n=1 Tax=uncultured Clostridium sp. TaxID=59620 RepID=UPI0028E23104|nr:alpha/beta-type small acid-soluble spore protein [uncultured Clostridium sp.]
MANYSSNRVLVPEAKKGLNQFKAEIATELGLSNYESMDKGNLTSRQNGSVGGTMVKRMIEAYERNL